MRSQSLGYDKTWLWQSVAGHDLASRSGGTIVHDVAARERMSWISRAYREFTRATAKVWHQLSLRRSRGRSGFVFQGPLLLGPVEQAQVVQACAFLALDTGPEHAGNSNGGKQAYDGNHDHDFRQGESTELTFFCSF